MLLNDSMVEKFVGVRGGNNETSMAEKFVSNVDSYCQLFKKKEKKETTRQTTRELFFFRGGEGRRLVQVSGYFVAINTEHVQDITA
jgi:hypothetical protein